MRFFFPSFLVYGELNGLTGGTTDSPERNDVGVVVVHVEGHVLVGRILQHDRLVIEMMGWDGGGGD